MIAAIVAAISATAVANDYRFEVDTDFLSNEVNNNVELETYFLAGTFYLTPVDDSIGPKAEAVFLHKSSDIQLSYGRTNFEAGIVDEDGDIWAISSRFVTGNGIILEANYATIDIDNVANTKRWGFGIGYYLNDTSTIALAYLSTKADAVDFDEDVWSAGYKTLLNDSINLEAKFDYSDPKSGKKAYGLTGAADYYFNENASIGGVLGNVSSDDDFTKAWIHGVRGGYFFNSMIAVNAGYTVSVPDKGDDNSIWSIGLTGRF